MSDTDGYSVGEHRHSLDDIFPMPRSAHHELLGSDEVPMFGVTSTGPDACVGVAMGFGSWGQYAFYGS